MSEPRTLGSGTSRSVRRYALIAIACWSVLIAGLLIANIAQVRSATRSMAMDKAREGFDKDLAFRRWSAMHGGVYVPATDETPPNPHLAHIPDRDITKSDGTPLTLMNPAYMIRQFSEEFGDEFSARTHITSMKLLRPENAPDEWERAALDSFEQGETSVTELTEIDGEPHLRYMEAMITSQACLKCHAHQGYKVGDVRGGIAVSLSMAPYLAQERSTLATLGLSNGGLWLLGVAGILLATRQIRRRILERSQATTLLAEQKALFQTVIDSTPDSIVLKDRDSVYRLVNPAFCEFLGKPANEIVGRTDSDLFPEAEAQAYREGDIRVMAGNETEVFDGNVTGANGERWFQVAKTPVRDPAGTVTGLLCSVRDLTELKAATDAAQRRLGDLERFEQVALGRELCLRELKEEVNTLLDELGRESAYRVDKLDSSAADAPATSQKQLTPEDRVRAMASLAADALQDRDIAERDRTADDEAKRHAEDTLRQLNETLEEKENLYQSMLGREDRMLELKSEVNALLVELGREHRYHAVSLGAAEDDGR